MESAYLLGILGNPNNYEIGAEFITARLRWGVNRDADSWFRGYNQVSGGVGAGFIDSTDAFRNGQGQDFTFNILTQAGVDYLVNDHWKINIGALYQHLSNAGQTDPNPSLNLIGPQVGVTYSF